MTTPDIRHFIAKGETCTTITPNEQGSAVITDGVHTVGDIVRWAVAEGWAEEFVTLYTLGFNKQFEPLAS